ncbi:MAG: ornithine cyclodeaminase family protein [Chloroflexota bacterium]|nr:ornithine cyclodeaminase family protein [Chloroflexota bacterium]
MTALPFLDADALRSAVPVVELIDAVEQAYRDVAGGRDASPARSRVAMPNGDLLLMPGLRRGGLGASIKLVTVTPANAARGLPTVQAILLWIDAETGTPRALLDGAELTAIRTGAGTGAATRLLARTDASVLAQIGAGAQAAWQVRAVLAVRPIREVRVYARGPSRDALAGRFSDDARVVAVGSAREAIQGADIICCATTSNDPVFDADWVGPGTHVNAIGAFRPDMVELPPPLFRRAALVAVDSRGAALVEAGDVLAAIEAGELVEGDVIEIGSLTRNYAGRRDPEAITIFKSVGLAIQDLAASELIVPRLLSTV